MFAVVVKTGPRRVWGTAEPGEAHPEDHAGRPGAAAV